MSEVSVFVAAGGRSTRMGADKAFVKLAGRTLLERALDLARSINPHPSIVGPAPKFAAFAPVVEDVFSGQGPLAAIHAALRSSSSELNLILAVDLPLLTPVLLQYLVARAAADAALVTVPRVSGGWHPLCAIYRLSFAGHAEQALRAGRNKIDLLFAEVPTLTLEERDLIAAGVDPARFRNLNTPEDLKAAELLITSP